MTINTIPNPYEWVIPFAPSTPGKNGASMEEFNISRDAIDKAFDYAERKLKNLLSLSDNDALGYYLDVDENGLSVSKVADSGIDRTVLGYVTLDHEGAIESYTINFSARVDDK